MDPSRATSTAFIPLAPEGLDFLPFQRAGVEYCFRQRRVLLADEMGLGKTIQALGLVNSDPTIDSVLVICPASLKLNWKKEALTWLMRPFVVRVVDRKTYDTSIDFAIVNYEQVVGKPNAEFRDQLLCRRWDLLIADEAHYMKNPKALRTIAVLGGPRKTSPNASRSRTAGLSEAAQRLLFLTGTPILNRPRELWPLLEVLAPGRFGSWLSYRKRYCGAFQQEVPKRGGGTQLVWNDGGASNLPELNRKLRETCMIRRLKKDVLKDLPEKVRQLLVIPAPSRGKVAGALRREQKLFAEHKWKIDQLEVKSGKLLDKTSSEYAKTLAQLKEAKTTAFGELAQERKRVAIEKVPAVAEHVASMVKEGVRRILVFCHHREVTEDLAREIQNRTRQWAIAVTGERGVAQRQQAVDWFQKEEAKSPVKVLVCTIGSMGTGHTLTAASHVVFAELDWVPANVTQAEDRAHRIGTKDTVFVQHLVLEGSLDVRIAKTIMKKQKNADQALGSEPVDPF